MEGVSRIEQAPARPLVAIVTPVYNGAKWLEGAALASMKAQTYRPLVHIILDNASADGTSEIIAKYAAEASFPVIIKRNPETLPQVKNFSAAVALVPPEAAYFATLCADDMMLPDAVSEMMALAEGRDDLVLIGGQESVNGVMRPSYLPPVSYFDAVNMAARILEDDARPPFPHVLIRRDFLHDGEELFNGAFVGCDAELTLRILVSGGSFGFVHKHLFNNLHHTETVTHAMSKRRPYLWEWFQFIERFGPSVLTNAGYKRLRRRHLRIVRRRLLFWTLSGAWDNVRREVPRFRARGVSFSLLTFLDALLSVPGRMIRAKLRQPSEPFTWPTEAYRREAAQRVRTPQT